MHRLIVSLLAALDAVIVVAVALLVALAPLAVVWIVVFGTAADWSALWPTGASVWMLGNLVPLGVTIPETLAIPLGIAQDAASFTIALAPLAFAAFTVIFGVKSGGRAARAGSWLSGWIGGTLAFGAMAAGVALTASNEVVAYEVWQAILIPTAIYAGAVLGGGVVTAWRTGDDFVIDRLRLANETVAPAWRPVVPLIARGSAVAVTSVIGIGALLVALSLVLHGDQIVTLFQTAHVDALGATVLTLGQAAYLPTFIGWAIAWVAGPGFALGTGTVVSPVGTQLGVVPGIPVLGALPESSTPWLLVVVLLPIAAGALAGWVCRSILAQAGLDARTSPRLVIALGIATVAGAAGALIALATSGSAGPGSLAHVGPEPGPLALTLAVEVLIGAAILLLSPRGAVPERDAAPAVVAGPDPAR
ncbi:MAG TPA: DUF6350 family protein [Microbacteriaceae bacterium]|nr:DUF6350 family protein [Microbacteriaceae bacterium]HQX34943.1 DUF6350 family protein [Microbacteriaceae bacterium]HQZ47360.1 DUF6350 family protein [Microbacteriaceae bacterium]HRA09241.1 DUF6350 family protein [Microbacteriaceae bacterium]